MFVPQKMALTGDARSLVVKDVAEGDYLLIVLQVTAKRLAAPKFPLTIEVE